MTLTLEEVEHIAQLARLELSAAEKERYRQQLSAILEYAARLQALDTRGIEPDSGSSLSAVHPAARLRPDVSEAGLPTPALLRNAPAPEQNQFKVPPVLE
jgi:aspartyl-tRNA(Asn)/glutamyl-tRNA(Gln) amidotransferase subunit C